MPSGGGSVGLTTSISHKLGYAPVLRLFVETPFGSGKWYNDSNSLDLIDDVNTGIAWKVIDINEGQIVLFFVVPDGGTVRFKYWLFEDSLFLE